MNQSVTRLTEATTAEEKAANRASEAFSDPDSLTGLVDAVHRAFQTAYPSSGDDGPWNHVEEVYENRVLAMIDNSIHEIPFTYSADDAEVTFGEATKVKVGLTVTPLAEAATVEPERFQASFVAHIEENLDEKEGRVWRVTMVRPGISKNGRRYRPEVLADAIHLYEGTKSFDGHRDAQERRKSAIGGMAGWHENVTAQPDGSLGSDFHISESAEAVRQLFVTAWRNERPDLIGFSHDISAKTEPAVVGGRRISEVRKIVEVHSVDVVADPSAGGQIERLVASRQEEDNMTLEQFLRALRAGDLTAEQAKEAYVEHPEWEQIVEAFEEQTAAAAAGEGDDPTEPVTESGDDGTEDSETVTGALRTLAVADALSRSNLPEAAHEQLHESLSDEVTVSEIAARISETEGIWSAALAATPSQLPGQTSVVVGEEAEEKLQHGLDAMIAGDTEKEGVPAFRSIKEAYAAFTGKNPYQMGDEDFNRWILAESVGAFPSGGAQRLTESLSSGSWAEALGDSIRRKLIAEYNSDPLSSWRQIVSEVGNLPDFRTNRRVRIGGYDVLATVAEGATYTALTSPTDEEATFAATKKGGTEDYTLEMIANDDLGGLRRIPVSMARAAALTLYRLIWNTTIAGNATIYDAVALFDAAHTNTTVAALGEAGIETLRTKMVRQTRAGETSGFVGLMPAMIAVPPELYVLAFKLTESASAVVGSAESATTPNVFRGLTAVEVPTFTDADDWFLIADPRTVPTIEVGFYQGRQDPELLIQDQPAVGSVFTADKFTWKIRHIYGAAVLDFRGFQRGTQ